MRLFIHFHLNNVQKEISLSFSLFFFGRIKFDHVDHHHHELPVADARSKKKIQCINDDDDDDSN